MGLDKRLGRSFLYPGVGYGGSCFPKDVSALIAIAKEYGYNFSILTAVEEVNKEAASRFIDKISRHFHGDLKGKLLTVLGLSFKPDTDDMRSAPSVEIIGKLTQMGARIRVFDPVAMENAKPLLPTGIFYAKDAYDAARGADAVIVVTEWNEFRQLDLVRLAKELKERVLFDGRNVYDPNSVKQLGFMYYGVGRM